ncbi:MAG: hypothetical protein CUN53_10620 [Phototrophicales bacterium]|nr:MAG: hypothetical protein CUN53_10620 [Phototrophicales bacterium]
MSQQPPKRNFGAVPASKRRAARKAREAQQAANRRSFSVTGVDPVERERAAVKRSAERQQARQSGDHDDMTAYLLAHPTRIVSEDDLRRDYTYVINDLRSMGLLAMALVVLLVVLAQVLPT